MGLREDLRTEPIRNLTMRDAVTVLPSVSVRMAAERMHEQKIGALIVVNDEGLPVGMFTEKLLIRVLALNPSAMDQPVGSHMSNRCICLGQDEPVARLIAVMLEHNLRWVCVVDESGLPVGLTGLRGVIEFVVDELPRLVKVQPIDPMLSMPEREGA